MRNASKGADLWVQATPWRTTQRFLNSELPTPPNHSRRPGSTATLPPNGVRGAGVGRTSPPLVRPSPSASSSARPSRREGAPVKHRRPQPPRRPRRRCARRRPPKAELHRSSRSHRLKPNRPEPLRQSRRRPPRRHPSRRPPPSHLRLRRRRRRRHQRRARGPRRPAVDTRGAATVRSPSAEGVPVGHEPILEGSPNARSA